MHGLPGLRATRVPSIVAHCRTHQSIQAADNRTASAMAEKIDPSDPANGEVLKVMMAMEIAKIKQASPGLFAGKHTARFELGSRPR